MKPAQGHFRGARAMMGDAGKCRCAWRLNERIDKQWRIIRGFCGWGNDYPASMRQRLAPNQRRRSKQVQSSVEYRIWAGSEAYLRRIQDSRRHSIQHHRYLIVRTVSAEVTLCQLGKQVPREIFAFQRHNQPEDVRRFPLPCTDECGMQ